MLFWVFGCVMNLLRCSSLEFPLNWSAKEWPIQANQMIDEKKLLSLRAQLYADAHSNAGRAHKEQLFLSLIPDFSATQ